MSFNVQDKILQYIQCSGVALEKAEKQAAAHNELQKKVDEMIPNAVNALLSNGRLQSHQAKEAAVMLRDPVKALEILIKTAEHRNDEELAKLGSQVAAQTKLASAKNSLNNPYVGARTSSLKESDIRLFEKLGLAVPTE